MTLKAQRHASLPVQCCFQAKELLTAECSPLQDWAQQEKAKQQTILEGWNPDAEAADGGAAVDGEEEPDDNELPFACFICRRRWENCQVCTHAPVLSVPPRVCSPVQ